MPETELHNFSTPQTTSPATYRRFAGAAGDLDTEGEEGGAPPELQPDSALSNIFITFFELFFCFAPPPLPHNFKLKLMPTLCFRVSPLQTSLLYHARVMG